MPTSPEIETFSAAQPEAPALPVWIAVDPGTARLVELAHKIAATASTVLIMGESGTGKDQLAQLLHFISPRRHEPYVKIDCSSLPTELMESELFGYEKGAFTGAHQAKQGRLEMASNGTLVLDEIAALSLPLQAKLLRVIEEKAFERLGGHATIRIHARLLALTNVDLAQAVAKRAFREDLYYRLFVLPVVIPPLRERPGDILPLTEHFLRTLVPAKDVPPVQLSPAARRALLAYSYPGNVRELRNLISRALIWGTQQELDVRDFPPYLAQTPEGILLSRTLAETEQEQIESVLAHFKGNKIKAAAVLGITTKVLRTKRRQYGLDLPWTERLPAPE